MRTFLLAAGLLAIAAPGTVEAQQDCQSYIEQIEQALRTEDTGAEAVPDPGTGFEDVKLRAELTDTERKEVRGYLDAARQHAAAGDSGKCMTEIQKANSKVFVMDDSQPLPEDDAAAQ